MANFVAQGNLNRIKASVVWAAFPALNVTAPFLDKDGVSLRFTGTANVQHGTMTGQVNSPEVYQPCELIIALLKTQALSEAYKTQMELYSVLGDGAVYPDVQGDGVLSAYQLHNMSMSTPGDLPFNGSTPQWGITLTGYYLVNSQLFS